MAATMARAPEGATKGFGELEAEVINAGRCTECRACVDLCAADGPEALRMDLGSFTFDADRCNGCGLCYAVCPEAAWAWDELSERYALEETEIGRTQKVTSAVTRNAEVKAKSADGGVVTSLLLYLLDTGQVDGAILSHDGGPVGPNLFVARTREDVLRASGVRSGRGASLATRLGVVTNIDLIAFLRTLHKEDAWSRERLAIVGTPCQTYTLRRLQQIGVAPATRIASVLGLLCYEALPLNKVQWKRFEEATGLRVEDVERVHMREELLLTMKDGRTRKVDLDTAALLAGPNCLKCIDFTSRFADLSMGAVGSEPGFTTVVVRTENGRATFDGAVEAGYLSEWSALFDETNGKQVEKRIRERLRERTRKKAELARVSGRVRKG